MTDSRSPNISELAGSITLRSQTRVTQLKDVCLSRVIKRDFFDARKDSPQKDS